MILLSNKLGHHFVKQLFTNYSINKKNEIDDENDNENENKNNNKYVSQNMHTYRIVDDKFYDNNINPIKFTQCIID